ncbi:PilW family protein [Luteimonas sp. MJ250]|uniref:PilW family protein n=1 Tax=Luteimonas sp. MJ250 TaxID=3129236 RepID=UPI0031BAB55E
MSTIRYARGLSLIEIMVALAISSLLILGLVQVFSASRSAYQLSEGLARTQENARFAIDFLQRDIRMAGHFGCVNDQAHFVKNEGDPRQHFGGAGTITPGAGHPLDFTVSVEGYEAPGTGPGQSLTIGGSWAIPAGMPAEVAALDPARGSDVLVLRYLYNEGAPVTGIATAGSGETLTVDASRFGALTNGGVPAPVMFGVTDCNHADVFPGATGGGTTVSTPANYSFEGRYVPAPNGLATLYRAESIVYYVAMNSAGEPALWRARADGAGAYPAANREELVEGIESMQLLFGQDEVVNITSASPPRGNITVQNTAEVVRSGTPAQRVTQWRRVGLVQVGLLARSPNRASAAQAAEGAARQRVLGVEFIPGANNDARYRASYEATVALRNRLFGN